MTDAQMQEVHEGQQEIADARAVDAFFADVKLLAVDVGETLTGRIAATVVTRATGGTSISVLQRDDESVGECVRRAVAMSRMSDTEFQCWCDHSAKAHEPKCREANGLE